MSLTLTQPATIDPEKIRADSLTLLNGPPQHEREPEEESDLTSFPEPSPDCFHGLAGSFVRLVEPHSEADPMALLLQFLTYHGNVAGRNSFVLVEDDRHYPNLFTLITANTSDGRKGTSYGRVRNIFKGIDESHDSHCHVSGLASGEGITGRFADAKLSATGEVLQEGAPDKRGLVIESEMVSVFRKQRIESSTLSAVIRDMWDTGTRSNLTKSLPVKATNVHFSIICHITKVELVNALSEVEAGNGYANRFLFCAARRSKFLPLGSEIPESEYIQLKNRLAQAVQFSKTTNHRFQMDRKLGQYGNKIIFASKRLAPAILQRLLSEQARTPCASR